MLNMISALAWVPRGAAKPVMDEMISADPSLVDSEVLLLLLCDVLTLGPVGHSKEACLLAPEQEGAGDRLPDEADGLESEGESSDSDAEMDEAAQIAQAKAVAASLKAKPSSTSGKCSKSYGHVLPMAQAP